MDRWSDKYVARLTEGNALANNLAKRLAEQARVNLLTSTQIDGTPMTTFKKVGKPLIDSGAMLGSINNVDNTVVVNVPYAATVQASTGNYFIGKPPAKLLGAWIEDFLAD